MIDWRIALGVKQPKQLELFNNEPSYLCWLAEVNHERRQNNERYLGDTPRAKRKFERLVAKGFWN
jgi:hypothetical protein